MFVRYWTYERCKEEALNLRRLNLLLILLAVRMDGSRIFHRILNLK